MAVTTPVNITPPQHAPNRSLKQRALAMASSAAAAPRRMLRQLLHWKQFKVPSAPAGDAASSAAANNPARRLSLAPRGVPAAPRARPAAAGARRPGVVWFLADLRLHDHEALARAAAECSSLLPVYCFDPRDYGRSPQGYDRTGPYRAAFLVQAVADLRRRLRAAGSELVVRVGRPEEVLAEVVRRVGAAAVYCHSEVSAGEAAVEARVGEAVGAAGASLRAFWTNTLHHPDDLPFPLADLPASFEAFRRAMAGVAPRAALGGPAQLRGVPAGAAAAVEAGEVPTLRQLGLEPLPAQGASPGAAACAGGETGGETEALAQLAAFVAAARGGGRAAPGGTRAGSFSSGVAPWLATGCLSPRRLLEEAQRGLGPVEREEGGQEGGGQGGGGGLQWVVFELLWRDFFRLQTKRHAEVVLPRALRAAADAQTAACA
jgi:deoxyribodipyrimidine photolyase